MDCILLIGIESGIGLAYLMIVVAILRIVLNVNLHCRMLQAIRIGVPIKMLTEQHYGN